MIKAQIGFYPPDSHRAKWVTWRDYSQDQLDLLRSPFVLPVEKNTTAQDLSLAVIERTGLLSTHFHLETSSQVRFNGKISDIVNKTLGDVLVHLRVVTESCLNPEHCFPQTVKVIASSLVGASTEVQVPYNDKTTGQDLIQYFFRATFFLKANAQQWNLRPIPPADKAPSTSLVDKNSLIKEVLGSAEAFKVIPRA